MCVPRPLCIYCPTPTTMTCVAQAAEAAGRDILEVGTELSVYWPGSDEWFTTCVLGHRASLEGKRLKFKHRCEYPGGFIEHDLHEVLQRPRLSARNTNVESLRCA